MFGLGPATKIYVAVESVDMRKGFDGLYGLVRDRLGHDPLSGHLFLFANRECTRLKVLAWGGSGLWVCAKRLEKGRFRWPAATEDRCLVMRPEELAMLLNGLDIGEARPRKNWLRRLPAEHFRPLMSRIHSH
jgi:transposase